MNVERSDMGPPSFRFGEIVRIVGTVDETYWLGDTAYPSDMFLGYEVAVHEAFPTADHSGWLIGVWVPDPAVSRIQTAPIHANCCTKLPAVVAAGLRYGRGGLGPGGLRRRP